MTRVITYQARIIFLLVILTVSFVIGKNCECHKLPTKSDLMAHLRFIASDELKGRKVGTDEIKIAARYIAEQFRASGLRQFMEYDSYLQPVELNIDKNIIHCNNVVGYIEGSDESLRDEFILLMAHYDHLGVIIDTTISKQDSIYNGARDNGMGIVALLYAAKYFSINTPKRSIIFLATTGEEEGMLGSEYFTHKSFLIIDFYS